MQLTASDFASYRRPTPCDLRVFLRHHNVAEAEPGPYEEVLRKLGIKHEQRHLASLGKVVDVSDASIQDRVQKTIDAIRLKAPALYQPAFSVSHHFGELEILILGIPDFLILQDDGYLIRDSKMARRISEEHHPEILHQLRLYGWLYEKSCGSPPRGLQVHCGTGDIITVDYDGGSSALQELERLMKLKLLGAEPYEPVGWSKCLDCAFTDRCWAKAEENCDIALIYGVDQSLARELNRLGILSYKDLLDAFDVERLSELKRPYGRREQRVGRVAQKIMQFAEAMKSKQEIVISTPAIPNHENYVMFDLEGMPPRLDELDKIYLWGTQVFGINPRAFMPAVSRFGADGDQAGWLAFLSNAKTIFEQYGDIPFVHWADYERIYLERYRGRFGDPEGIAERVAANLLNLLTVTKEAVVLPLPSFSLKVIEDYVGYKRKETEFGGGWAMAKFIEATETDDENKRQELMDRIIAYNREDLEATWAVFEWLRAKKA